MEGLTAFCKAKRIFSGQVRGIGACELLVDKFGDTSVGRYLDSETGLNLYGL